MSQNRLRLYQILKFIIKKTIVKNDDKHVILCDKIVNVFIKIKILNENLKKFKK